MNHYHYPYYYYYNLAIYFIEDHSKVLTDDFHLQHGDVVELLDETEQKQLREDWMFGKSERTGKTGPFPFDSIYILPTSEKPPKTFLVCIIIKFIHLNAGVNTWLAIRT